MIATPAKKMTTMSRTTSLAGRSLFRFHDDDDPDPDPEELPLVAVGCVPVPDPAGLLLAHTPGVVLQKQMRHATRNTSRNPVDAKADAADGGEDDDKCIISLAKQFYSMPCPTLRMGFPLERDGSVQLGTKLGVLFCVGDGAREERNNFLSWICTDRRR